LRGGGISYPQRRAVALLQFIYMKNNTTIELLDLLIKLVDKERRKHDEKTNNDDGSLPNLQEQKYVVIN